MKRTNRKSSNVLDYRIDPLKQRMGYTSRDQGQGAKRDRPTSLDGLVTKLDKHLTKRYGDTQTQVGNQFKTRVLRGAIARDAQRKRENKMAKTVSDALNKFRQR